jgi:outer membrane protein
MNGPGTASSAKRFTILWCVLAIGLGAFPLQAQEAPEVTIQEEEILSGRGGQENIYRVRERFPLESIPVLSLQQVLEYTLERNPVIAASGNRVQATEARYKQERSAYFPQLDAKVQFHRYWMDLAAWANTPGSPLNFAPDENYPAATVAVSQYIYEFGKTTGRVNRSRHELAASRKQHVQASSDIVLETQLAYYEVLKRRSFVGVQEKSVRVYDRHYQQAKDFLEAGIRPQIDVTKAAVALSKARRALIKARYSYRISRIALENVMGGPPVDGAYRLVDIVEAVPEPVVLEGLIPQAMEVRPEIARVNAEIDAARAATRSAFGGYFPSLRADAAFDWQDADIAWYHHAWIVGVTMDWNLFSGLRTWEEVKEGKAMQASLRNRLRQEELRVIKEVSQAVTRVNESVEDVRTSTVILEEAVENLELSQDRYQNGLGDYLEFSDAELTWRKAEYDLAAARYGYFQSMADLDFAMGRTAEILGEQPEKREERSAEARDVDRSARRSHASGLARR